MMKKVMILLAGYPGTGKSYLAKKITGKFPDFFLLSPDDIKEKNWDKYGFNNLKEKEELIRKSWQEYYQIMEDDLRSGKLLISEYPFSEKQRKRIELLGKQFGYKIMTIRLVGDLNVLFERQQSRDLDNSRHLGHIMHCYHLGDKRRVSRESADNLLDFEEFVKRCKQNGYGEFSLGTLYELDVTDFSKVDYTDLMKDIAGEIEN